MLKLYKKQSDSYTRAGLGVLAYSAEEAQADNTQTANPEIGNPLSGIGLSDAQTDSIYAEAKEAEWRAVTSQDSLTTAHENAANNLAYEISEQSGKGNIAGPWGFVAGTVTGAYDGVKENCSGCHSGQ